MLSSNIILVFLIQIIIVGSNKTKNSIKSLPDYDLIISGSYEQDETFYVGENITFLCFLRAAKNRTNKSIVWNVSNIDNNFEIRSNSYSIEKSFFIQNISRNFEIVDYKCTITDGSRKVLISESLQLLDPPESFLEIKPISPLKKYLKNEDYEIKANATGFPTPIKKYWIWTPFFPINSEMEYYKLKLKYQSKYNDEIDDEKHVESVNDRMYNSNYKMNKTSSYKYNQNYGPNYGYQYQPNYHNNSYIALDGKYDDIYESSTDNYDSSTDNYDSSTDNYDSSTDNYEDFSFDDVLQKPLNSLWNVSFSDNTKSGVEAKYEISGSTLADSGNYTFVAENVYAKKNKTFQIYVKGLEMLGFDEVYMKWGERKEISCEAYAYPKVTKFEWSITPCFWILKPQYSCDENRQNYFRFSFGKPKSVGLLHYSSWLNFTHDNNLTPSTGFAFGLINCLAFTKDFNKKAETHLYIGGLIEPKIIYSNDKEINEMFKKNGTAKKSFKPGAKFNITCEGIKSKYRDHIQWCKKLNKTSKDCLLLNQKDLNTKIYQTSTESTYQSTLMFLQLEKANNGLYQCLFKTLLENKVEVISAFEINLQYELHPWLHYLTSGIIIALLIITAVLIFYYCKYIKMRKRLKELGLENFANGKPDSINPEIAISEQAELLPYKKKYEIPKSKVQLGKILGQGAFGYVYMASLNPNHNKNIFCFNVKETERAKIVAVKMIKQDSDPRTLQALSRELKILQHIGQHCYVINLLGAVTKTIYKCELMLIMEYCKHGSLDIFLVKNRTTFVDQIDSKTDQIYLKQIDRSNLDSDSASNESGNQSNDKLLMDSNETDNEKKRHSANLYITSMKRKQEKLISFNTTDLIMWSQQIACGMNHLASLRIVHGDLAARNVLLSDNFNIKISDFGLANQMYEDEQYKQLSHKQLLPIKWYSIEAIEDRKLTTESDVWSYGVVLWELFSLGKVPYSDIEHIDRRFIYKLKKGYRLEQPCYGNRSIYNIMLSCWKTNPLERPKFDDLSKMFKKYQIENIVSHYDTPVVYDNAAYAQSQKLEEGPISFFNNSYEMQPIYEEIDPRVSTNCNDIIQVHSSPLMDNTSKFKNTLMSSNDYQNADYLNSQFQPNKLSSASEYKNADPSNSYVNLTPIKTQMKGNFLNEMKITLNAKNTMKKAENFENYQNI